MAGQIRITPEQMRTRANDFRRAGEDFDQVVGTMSNLISTLQDEWEGQASQNFAMQFESIKSTTFKEVLQLINDIAKQCDDTANAVEQLDNDIANKFS